MTSVSRHTEPRNSGPRHPEPQPAGLQPPQFSLRSLFWVVTGCCLIFAVMASVSMVVSAILLLVIVLISAHVLGNSLGMQLRDSNAPERNAVDDSQLASSTASITPRMAHLPSGLSKKSSVGRPILLISLACGLLAGAFGGVLLGWYQAEQITLGGLVVGAVASGIIGGLGGFFAASCAAVAYRAWREMWHAHPNEQSTRNEVAFVATIVVCLVASLLALAILAWRL